MATILEAVQTLAGVCNYASSWDGHGFNKFDAERGHSLAGCVRLTSGQQNMALRLLKKYEKQLARHGINYAQLRVDDVPAPKPQKRAWTEGNVIRFAFPYNEECKNNLKLSLSGARFDGDKKEWYVSADQATRAREWCTKWNFDSTGVKDAPAPQGALVIQKPPSAYVSPEQYQNAGYTKRLNAIGDLKKPLTDGKVLRDYQIEGVKTLLKKEFVILADDMGLGKTLQALVTARAYQKHGYAIFVVAPVTLHDNWRREAQTAGVTIEIFSWAKIPEPLEKKPYILIADEAHYAQNSKLKRVQWEIPQSDGTVKKFDVHPETGKKNWTHVSQRTGKLLKLAERASAVFLLTGTPIKNGRPTNLYALLEAVRHPLTQGWSAQKSYERRYCFNPTAYHENDTTGASYLEELHEKTKDVILRRLKKDHLHELPEKKRIAQRAELSHTAMLTYQKTFEKLRADYERRLNEGKIGTGGEALVLLNNLRHAGSISKIDAAVEFAEEILEQGQSIIIFSEFTETARAIAEKLQPYGVSLLTGDTEQKHRQPLVDTFQSGKNRVFIGTIQAGGIGLTLTAASTVLLVDRAWTPGSCVQAEDRAHRIGQKNAVFAYWLQAHDIDMRIDKLLMAKAENIGKALGEETAITGEELLGIVSDIFG